MLAGESLIFREDKPDEASDRGPISLRRRGTLPRTPGVDDPRNLIITYN